MKKLITALLVFGLAAPVIALAEDQAPTTFEGHPDFNEGAFAGVRTTKLGELLNLSVADTAKLGETLKPFDAQRAPLHQQMKESFSILKQAQAGDATAASQVDSATTKIFDAQTKMASIRQAEFQAVTKDLTPAQKAKVAMFFAHGGHHGHHAWKHRAGGDSTETPAPGAP